MANTKTEDEKGRQIVPIIGNESEDGTGTAHVLVCDSSGRLKVSLQNVGDDVLFKWGADADVVALLRSTILNANTALTGVLIGTPVTQAIAADSFMLSNIKASGDIAFYVNKGGHSQMVFWADASTGDTVVMAASGASFDIYIAGTKEYDFATNQTNFNSNGIIELGNVFMDNDKGLVIGHTSQVTVAGQLLEMQVLGTSVTDSSYLVGRWGTGGGAASFFVIKSRGAAIGDIAIVNDGDNLLQIRVYGDDGVDYATEVARITARVDDGTPAENAVGGEWIFDTATTGGTLTEALRLDSSQNAFFGGDIDIGSNVFKVSATQVVGARVIDARIDDAINSGDGTTDGVIDAIRDALITHGLVTAS